MRASLVLFDIDGTLIRTGGAGIWAFAETSTRLYGLPGGTDGLHFHGRTDRSLVCEFLRLHGIPETEAQIRRFMEGYTGFLAERLLQHRGEVCPGVEGLIRSLREIPNPPQLGVLTGNSALGAQLKLKAHGLEDLLVFGVYGEDESDRNLLAHRALKMAQERFGSGFSGREMVVVGDTPADIACARAVGARCVAVSTGGSSLEVLLEHSPDWAVPTLEGFDPEHLLSAGDLRGCTTDWEYLYQSGETFWDKGQPAPGLVDFLAKNPEVAGHRVLIPGCGRGHDCVPWTDAGARVLGMDLSPRAVEEASKRYPDVDRLAFAVGDFLATPGQHGQHDWVFEHTLWCAIVPEFRDSYVAAVAAAVRPRGHYLAINYLQPADPVGPPHGVTVTELHRRLSGAFELLEDWVPRSFEGRKGRERMFLWRRRSSEHVRARRDCH